MRPAAGLAAVAPAAQGPLCGLAAVDDEGWSGVGWGRGLASGRFVLLVGFRAPSSSGLTRGPAGGPGHEGACPQDGFKSQPADSVAAVGLATIVVSTTPLLDYSIRCARAYTPNSF